MPQFYCEHIHIHTAMAMQQIIYSRTVANVAQRLGEGGAIAQSQGDAIKNGCQQPENKKELNLDTCATIPYSISSSKVI